MVGEIFASLSGFKSMMEIAKGLKDMSDAAVRNATAIELQEQILAAQAAQSVLIDQVRDLERKLAGFEAWEAERKRYALTDFGGDTFAYALRPEAANGEPLHRLCPNCFEQRRKSILQFEFRTGASQDKYLCPSCKTEFEFGRRQQRNVNREPRGTPWSA